MSVNGEETFKDRLTLFLKYKKEGQKKFEARVGLANGAINNLTVMFKQEGLDKIATHNPELNMKWLIHGVGEMLIKKEYQSTPPASLLSPQGEVLIQLFDDAVTYGTPQGNGGTGTAIQYTDSYIAVGGWFKGATCAIRHYGDSMKEYPPGCILALKEMIEFDFVWGRNYVIEYGSDHTRITKKIQKGKTKGSIIAYSTNTYTHEDGRKIHEPKEIEISRIKRAFFILGVVVKEYNVSGVIPID